MGACVRIKVWDGTESSVTPTDYEGHTTDVYLEDYPSYPPYQDLPYTNRDEHFTPRPASKRRRGPPPNLTVVGTLFTILGWALRQNPP